jgi:hypothetical protein
MRIFKTVNDGVIVADQNELKFFNFTDIFRRERRLFSISILLLIVINMLLGDSLSDPVRSVLWIVLALVWMAYLVFHLFWNKYPEKIPLSEIHQIKYLQKKNFLILWIFYGDSKVRLKLKEDNLDGNVLEYFLENGVMTEEDLK